MLDPIQQILFLIHTQTHHDFSHYKQSMIRRCIERLMAVNQCQTLESYARSLQDNPIAIEMLFHELLIGVTSFFRDEEAFEALRDLVIPQLFQNRLPEQPVRIWVPACSTGEEAYSIAILIQEHMKTLKYNYKVQIFATDLDQTATRTARTGVYGASIVLDIRDDYLQRYFTQTPEGDYEVITPLRDMVIFAPHNLTTDPPFSKVDLISCRNLLIYLDIPMQEKILSSFHFALATQGFLFLGSAEGVGQYEDDFDFISIKHKIFQRLHGTPKFSFEHDLPPPSFIRRAERLTTSPEQALRSMTENLLLTRWTPTCIIVNEQGYVRYLHTRADKYLEIAPGEMNQPHIVNLARAGLKNPLKAALNKAVRQQQEVFVPGISFTVDDEQYIVHLTVQPLHHLLEGERLLAVILKEVKPLVGYTLEGDQALVMEHGKEAYRLLAEELNETRDSLQQTITKLETSNEGMRIINEELYSANEELQTSQQELRALNEELRRTNDQLEQKVVEMTWASNDLTNTMNIMQTGLILLDSDFHIRRFNPGATEVFELILSDIGRHISHVNSRFDYPQLIEDVEKVFETLISIDRDVQTQEGRWYAVQIRPYRTMQNAIKGIVIYFSKMTVAKE